MSIKIQLKSTLYLIGGLLISFFLCAAFWAGINLGYISLTLAIPIIFVSYLVYNLIWINSVKSFFRNYIVSIVFWLLLLITAMWLNFYRISNYYLILPYIITANLSFFVIYFYKNGYKKIFYSVLSTSIIFICLLTFYLLPLHFYNDSEITTSNEKLTEFKSKEIPLIDFTGKIVNLNNINAKIVFLEFGFADCPPCIEKLPILSKLRSNFAFDENIVFIHIVNGNADSFSDFQAGYREHGSNFDFFLYAPKESMKELAMFFKIKGFPFEKVFANNIAIFTHTGFSNVESTYYYNTRLTTFKKILK